MNNNQNNENNNGLNMDPSELIGRHFSVVEEDTKTQKHKNIKTSSSAKATADRQKHKNKEIKEIKKKNKEGNKTKQYGSSQGTGANIGKEVKKDPYEDLAKRLEGGLNGQSFGKFIDFRDEKEKKENPIDVLELGEDIDELQKELLPKQDIDPDRELEVPKDLELPISDKLEQKYKKELEKKQNKEELTRLKLLERVRLREEKQKQKAYKNAERQRVRELNKTTQRKISFGNYVNIIKRPVIYLAGIEFLIYFFSLINKLESFLLNIILPLVIFLDIVVFAWLAVRVVKRYNYPYRNRGIIIKTCLLAGIFIGFFRAIFKIIWINELWTLINIIVEPIILGGIAVIVGFVVSIFIKKRVADSQ